MPRKWQVFLKSQENKTEAAGVKAIAKGAAGSTPECQQEEDQQDAS